VRERLFYEEMWPQLWSVSSPILVLINDLLIQAVVKLTGGGTAGAA
tara:strand:- start:117 stop:254 length:138 start_codon:yes stop_codon:yes gene_type:complete